MRDAESPAVEAIVPALDDMALKSGSATPGSSVGMQDLETPRKPRPATQRSDGSRTAPVSTAPSLAWSNRDGSGIYSHGPPSSVSSSFSSPQLRPSTASSSFSTLSLPEQRQERPTSTRVQSTPSGALVASPSQVTPKAVRQQRQPQTPRNVHSRTLYGGDGGFFTPVGRPRRSSASQHSPIRIDSRPQTDSPRSASVAESAAQDVSDSPTRGRTSGGGPKLLPSNLSPPREVNSREAQSPNRSHSSIPAAEGLHHRLESSQSPVRSTLSEVQLEGTSILNSSPRRYKRRGDHDEAALTRAVQIGRAHV